MERKELNETLFTKAFETQHNAFLNSASRSPWVVRQAALTQRLASTVARETQNVAACCRNVRS
ncbi:hypothetical protein L9Z41_04695 [Leptospira noguchii]|uniref:hypothetical protein n=1 Tax=Leptospira noguchii TaxID=28182 RepID=UPI001F066E88|nr:hypothetical protein [Leptospira noguchii]MCH1910614.1 hypothetical protein [Leptospira noguchii]MCH1914958.1 hypothetical protein [Leptospira noguchii]UOG64850.1 hypothetical protein MAL04_04800 [Leptospira noguchii]